MYPTPVAVRALYPSILLAAGITVFRLHEGAVASLLGSRGAAAGGAAAAAAATHRKFLSRMAALVTGHTKSMRDSIDAGVFAELASLEAAMKVEGR